MNQLTKETILNTVKNHNAKNAAKLLYIYLLLKQGDSEELEGETLKTLSEGTGLTVTTVFTSLKELKGSGQVLQTKVDENVNQGYKYSVVKGK